MGQPTVDYDRLIKAMEAFMVARLMAMGSRRPRRHPDLPARTGLQWIDSDTAIRTALKEMRRGGVKIDQIPYEAMALLKEVHTPPEREHPALRPEGAKKEVVGASAGRGSTLHCVMPSLIRASI